MISIPVVSELLVAEIRRRQCRVPTVINCRETAVPIGVNLSLKALVSLAFT